MSQLGLVKAVGAKTGSPALSCGSCPEGGFVQAKGYTLI